MSYDIHIKDGIHMKISLMIMKDEGFTGCLIYKILSVNLNIQSQESCSSGVNENR